VTELDTDLWIRRFHRSPAGAPRLICFPYAGGAANFYFRLSAALQPEVEVLAVQYPGRQDRLHDPLIDDIIVLSEQIAAAATGLVDRPTAFFGHSMGAVVAYEVARRWEPQGLTVEHLLAAGRRAPSRHRDSAVHQLDDAGFCAEMAKLSGPDAAELLEHPELGPLLLPPVRNDYKAIETYEHVPGAPLSCPVTALVGDADPLVTTEEARAWAEHTTGPFALRVFAGGHFFLNDYPRELTRIARRALIST
jgi:pyochelin biosynthesis protein PchC